MEHLVTCVERFSDVIEEAKPLLARHWEEVALNKDTVPLDPDWARYAAVEALGQLSVVTVRAAGRMIGYCCMVVQPGLHYRSCLEARMDIFWIAPEYRGRMGGVRLFRAVEAELKRRGVKRMYVGSKLHKDSSRLFEALKYKEIERWYSKTLGDA
jgi:GNAT superfamily N-acetyltransferase